MHEWAHNTYVHIRIFFFQTGCLQEERLINSELLVHQILTAATQIHSLQQAC